LKQAREAAKQAKATAEQAKVAAKQQNTMMVFTVVTIAFVRAVPHKLKKD
jgi:hypothetical protein